MAENFFTFNTTNNKDNSTPNSDIDMNDADKYFYNLFNTDHIINNFDYNEKSLYKIKESENNVLELEEEPCNYFQYNAENNTSLIEEIKLIDESRENAQLLQASERFYNNNILSPIPRNLAINESIILPSEDRNILSQRPNNFVENELSILQVNEDNRINNNINIRDLSNPIRFSQFALSRRRNNIIQDDLTNSHLSVYIEADTSERICINNLGRNDIPNAMPQNSLNNNDSYVVCNNLLLEINAESNSNFNLSNYMNNNNSVSQTQLLIGNKRERPIVQAEDFRVVTSKREETSSKHLAVFCILYESEVCVDNCDLLIQKIRQKLAETSINTSTIFASHIHHYGQRYCQHIIVVNCLKQLTRTIDWWFIENFTQYYTNETVLWGVPKFPPAKNLFQKHIEFAKNPLNSIRFLNYDEICRTDQRNLKTLWESIKDGTLKNREQCVDYVLAQNFDEKKQAAVLPRINDLLIAALEKQKFPIQLKQYVPNQHATKTIRNWIENEFFPFINDSNNDNNFIKRTKLLVVKGARKSGKTTYFTQLLQDNPEGEPMNNPTIVYCTGVIAGKDFQSKPDSSYIVLDDVKIDYKNALQSYKKLCTGQKTKMRTLYSDSDTGKGRPCIMLLNNEIEYEVLRHDTQNWGPQDAIFVDLLDKRLYPEQNEEEIIYASTNTYIQNYLSGDYTVRSVIKSLYEKFLHYGAQRRNDLIKKLLTEIHNAMKYFIEKETAIYLEYFAVGDLENLARRNEQ